MTVEEVVEAVDPQKLVVGGVVVRHEEGGGRGGGPVQVVGHTAAPIWSSTRHLYFRAPFLFQFSLAEMADNTQVTERNKTLAQGKYKHS